jgi:hypothetical protein
MVCEQVVGSVMNVVCTFVALRFKTRTTTTVWSKADQRL